MRGEFPEINLELTEINLPVIIFRLTSYQFDNLCSITVRFFCNLYFSKFPTNNLFLFPIVGCNHYCWTSTTQTFILQLHHHNTGTSLELFALEHPRDFVMEQLAASSVKRWSIIGPLANTCTPPTCMWAFLLISRQLSYIVHFLYMMYTYDLCLP